MARQLKGQRYIYKIHSSRLRKAKWKLTLPLAEARRNEELITLASGQGLRWLDEFNSISGGDVQAKEIRAQIRVIRKEENSLVNRRKIRKLYEDLDRVQFRKDYLCVVMDRDKDFLRACKGFAVNGIAYERLVGTNGGVKEKTIVFVSSEYAAELKRRIDNGRDADKEMVTAKLESYKALVCSASNPVSFPKGLLVVSDCDTQFLADTVYVDDEGDGEPLMEYRPDTMVDLCESDGYGMMLPSLARRWGEELGLDYIPSGVNTRYAWEKGMVFCFDFKAFADEVANGQYMVKDAWGEERDIRDVELILTTSMVKLWDSYESCEDYLSRSKSNGYEFGITKVCPKELESERNLNYQFIQSYQLSEEDIDRLIAPTMNEIREILHADYQKTILFLKGISLNKKNVLSLEDDFVKALMVNPELIHDPYIQSRVYQLIRNRISEAKVGVIKVHGNYSIVSGDPYSLCQSIFGLKVTGILKKGEVFNKYWVDSGQKRVACFRAPMTCHNNIRGMTICGSSEAEYWYQYMTTCTVFNSWDTAAHAMNGMDKDGDLAMLTDNEVLVENLKELPALMCVQRKAQKRVSEEADFIQSNIDSFGDDIGKTTNRITSMFEVQAKFPPDSPEYKMLDYRIQCGQLFQQNAIDKAKGIIAKPMPKEWYDRRSVQSIEDPQQKELYLSILAEKKPYFMRYIYPKLMSDYTTYVKNTNKKSLREFSLPIEELIAEPRETQSPEKLEFIRYYLAFMPVGVEDCVVNRICRKFEEAFDGYVGRQSSKSSFDYQIMKGDVEYSKSQYQQVSQLLGDYNRRTRDYAMLVKKDRLDGDEASSRMSQMKEEFRQLCHGVCSNSVSLCEILLDLCYQRSSTKGFVWSVCGKEIIENLLERNGGVIHYPTLDEDGDIEYEGKRFSMKQEVIYCGGVV